MRRYATIMIVLVTIFAFFYPQQEAEAMDPVTIAILAPIAIQAAKIMMPYIIKGFIRGGKVMWKGAKEFINFFRFPLGLCQATFLAPFGKNFTGGLKNMGKGIIAPFKMCYYFIMSPVGACGVNI